MKPIPLKRIRALIGEFMEACKNPYISVELTIEGSFDKDINSSLNVGGSVDVDITEMVAEVPGVEVEGGFGKSAEAEGSMIYKLKMTRNA